MTKKLGTWILVLFLLASAGFAFSITQFTTGVNPQNITFLNNNNTLYLNISNLMNVTSATLTATAVSFGYYLNESASQNVTVTGLFGSGTTYNNPSNAFDNDWSTYSSLLQINTGSSNVYIYQNYTVDTIPEIINLKTGYEMIGTHANSNERVRIWCWNYTLSDWSQIYTKDTTGVSSVKENITTVLSSDCKNVNIIIKTLLRTERTYFNSAETRFYEDRLELSYLDGGSINFSIDTANDTYIDYVNESFVTDTIDLNVTSINSWISSNCTNNYCLLPIRMESVDYKKLLINSLQVNYTSTFGIDNCDAYTTKFANFTLREEFNETVLTGDVDYLVEYTYSILGNTLSGNYFGNETSISTFDLCMTPNWLNFSTIDLNIQYDVDNYDVRDYIVENFVMDNVTDQINLYSMLSVISEEVTVHVVDNEDNNLENILVTVYKWDIDSNTESIVETEYTDSDGNAIFTLKKDSEYYKFKFYQNEILVLETTAFKIFSSTLEYTLSTSQVSMIAEWININTIIRSITYNNATRTVSFTWNDSNSVATNICFNVSTFNQSYYEQCTTNNSGTISYTITTLNLSYYAQGIAQYDNGNYYTIATRTINTLTDWTSIGSNTSAIFTIIIFLTLALLGLVNKYIAVVMATITFPMLLFMGITPLTTSAVTGVVILGLITLMVIHRRPTV